MAKQSKVKKKRGITRDDLLEFSQALSGHNLVPELAMKPYYSIFTSGMHLFDYSGGALLPVPISFTPGEPNFIGDINAENFVPENEESYKRTTKRRIVAAKKCKAYKLFSTPRMQASIEKYLRHFKPLDTADFSKLHRDPFPEYFKLNVCGSLAELYSMYLADHADISDAGLNESKILRNIEDERGQLKNTLYHCSQFIGSITTPMAERLELDIIDADFIETLQFLKTDLQFKLEDLEYFERVEPERLPISLLIVRLVTNILSFKMFQNFKTLSQHTEKMLDRDVQAIKQGKNIIHKKQGLISYAASLSSNMSFETREGDILDLHCTPIGLPKTSKSKSSELRDILLPWCEAIAGESVTMSMIENRILTVIERRFHPT